MKFIVVVLLAVACSVSMFAQEVKISGEVKSGILWEKTEDKQPGSENIERIRLHSKDDAGSSFGRFRLNADYTNADGNMGIKIRLQWDEYNNEQSAPTWPYAFGWGNFFDDQLTVSVGKLGASPWGTGGPEMWRELEVSRFGGMRLEYKPFYVPGKLNVGFVLNWIDDIADSGLTREATLLDLLQESVVGASYALDWFMVRLAYRFDSVLDAGAARSGGDGQEGTKLIYRVEEYMLRNLLSDLSAWALGELIGLGADDPESSFFTRNWLFVQYAPPSFTAQIRFGLETTHNRSLVYAKPNFSYNLFNKLLVPSVMFGYAQDFGAAKIYPGSPFSYIEVEPKIQVNFAPGAYVAFSYYYRMEYKFAMSPPEQQAQWMNLRFGLSY